MIDCYFMNIFDETMQSVDAYEYDKRSTTNETWNYTTKDSLVFHNETVVLDLHLKRLEAQKWRQWKLKSPPKKWDSLK